MASREEILIQVKAELAEFRKSMDQIKKLATSTINDIEKSMNMDLTSAGTNAGKTFVNGFKAQVDDLSNTINSALNNIGVNIEVKLEADTSDIEASLNNLTGTIDLNVEGIPEADVSNAANSSNLLSTGASLGAAGSIAAAANTMTNIDFAKNIDTGTNSLTTYAKYVGYAKDALANMEETIDKLGDTTKLNEKDFKLLNRQYEIVKNELSNISRIMDDFKGRNIDTSSLEYFKKECESVLPVYAKLIKSLSVDPNAPDLDLSNIKKSLTNFESTVKDTVKNTEEALKEAVNNYEKDLEATGDPIGAFNRQFGTVLKTSEKLEASMERIAEESNLLNSLSFFENNEESLIAFLRVLKEIDDRYEEMYSSISAKDLGKILRDNFNIDYPDWLISGFNDLTDFLNLIDESGSYISADLDQLAEKFELDADKIRSTIQQMRSSIGNQGSLINFFEVPVEGLQTKLKNLANTIKNTFNSAISSTKDFAVSLRLETAVAAELLKTKITNFGKEAKKAFELVKTKITNFGKDAKKAFDSISWSKFNDSVSKTKQSFENLKGSISQLIKSTPGLNKIASALGNIGKKADEASESGDKASNSLMGMIKQLTPLLLSFVGFDAIKQSISNAMESIETQNMFDVVFGNSAEDMNNWVSEMNKTLGLGIVDTKKYTATLMQMGSAMGMASEDAMDMSKSMAVMAGDISSFYNVDLSQAQEDLQSAVSGSTDSLEKYGIMIDSDAVKNAAYANGIAELNSELTASQEAMTITMLIEQQLGVANGDLARSINSPANQARILQSNLNDLSIAFGNCFTPILTVVLPILNRFVSALTSVINKVASFVSKLFSLFGISTGSSGSSGGVEGSIGDSIGGITDSIEDFGDTISGGGVGKALDNAKNAIGGVGSSAKKAASDTAAAVKEIKKSLAGFDQINVITDKSKDSSSGGSGSGGSGSGGSGSGGSGGGSGSGGSGAGGGGAIGGPDDISSAIDEVGNKSEITLGEIEQWIIDFANALKAIWEQLKAGWMSVSDYIKASIEQLKQAFIKLGNAIKDFFIGVWNNGGKELLYNIGRLAGAVVGAAIDIAGQVVNAVANVLNYLNPETNKFTKGFIDALNKLLVAGQNFALSIGGWFSVFMNNGGQAFLNVMGDIVMLIGTILAHVLTDAINLITAFMNSWLGHAVLSAVAITLDVLAGAVKGVLIIVDKCRVAIYLLIAAILAFKLHNIINDFKTFRLSMAASKDAVLTLGQKIAFAQVKFGGLRKAALDTLIAFKNFIVNGIKSAIQGCINLGKEVVKLIANMIKLAAQFSANLISRVKGLFSTNIITSIKSMGTAILNAAKNAVTFGTTMIQNAWKAITGLVSTCASGIASLLGLSVAEGTATAGAVALNVALAALGIGLIIAAIVGLIAVIKNWSTITAKIKELWQKFMDFLGEKCPWLQGIFEGLGKVFSWIGEKVGWLWDKVKGFFGFDGGENNLEEETDNTTESLEELEEQAQSTSDSFGTAASNINQYLASINFDATKLAESVDAATSMMEEKFSLLSKNCQDYLTAIAEHDEEKLSEMSENAGAYTSEIASMWNDMTESEKNAFYAAYGEIQGINDGWMDYTNLSYSQMVERHVAYCNQIENDERLTYEEKQRLIAEDEKRISESYDNQLASLKAQLDEIDKLEGISNADRIAMKNDVNDQIQKLELDRSQNTIDNINNEKDAAIEADNAIKESAETNADAQIKSLEDVDVKLEDTKTKLVDFKTKSDETAKAIPISWKGISTTIGSEFTKLQIAVSNSLNKLNGNVKAQSIVLKTTLKSAFTNITTDVKSSMNNISNQIKTSMNNVITTTRSSMTSMSSQIKSSFTGISNNVKSSMNTMANQIKSSFNSIANSIKSSMVGVNSTITSAFNTMKNSANSALSQMANSVSNNCNRAKSYASNGANDIANSFGNRLNSLSSRVSNAFNNALSSMRYYVQQMKNTMNFTFPVPYLKLPHLQVYGDWDFEKKKVPSFGVRWYKLGGILTKPTAFGINGSNILAGGEAGPEAILPLERLWSELDRQFRNQNSLLNNSINRNSSDNRPVNITLKLNDIELGKATVDSLKALANHSGSIDLPL